MANLKLGQDVANKRKRKNTVAHIVANSYPLWQADRMRCYGSLINISPSSWFIVVVHGLFSCLTDGLFCS